MDGISGYLNLLGTESYWKDYSLIHALYREYQQYIGGTIEESEIPDSEMIKFWIQNTHYLNLLGL